MKKIYSFLDIDSAYIPHDLNERIHYSREAKSRILESTIVLIRKMLRRMRLFSVVEGLKARGLDKRLKQFNTGNNRAFKQMDLKTRSQLNQLFADDKKILSKLIGRDLSFWN